MRQPPLELRIPFMSTSAQVALVAWVEGPRHGDWSFHRRGTGETGIWHYHGKAKDCGGNPCDRVGETAQRACRTCGKVVPLEVRWLYNKWSFPAKGLYRHPHVELTNLRSFFDEGKISKEQWHHLSLALQAWYRKNKHLCRERRCSFYTDKPAVLEMEKAS